MHAPPVSGSSCTIIYRKMAPALRGLGYSMLSITVVINMYYTVIMAWGFQYMFEGQTLGLALSFIIAEV